MSGAQMQAVASKLLRVGATAEPGMILVRRVPLFEVELSELEFEVDGALLTTDWAALGLAHARGTLSAADIDAYLGFGRAVSSVVLNRLIRLGLVGLEVPKPAPKAAAAPRAAPKKAAARTGVFAFLRRLFGSGSRKVETPVPPISSPPPPPPAPARKVRESKAPATPLYTLTEAGTKALATGRVAERKKRPARLIFSAEPLLYFDVSDETKQNFTAHRRARRLEPGEVPSIFLRLDTELSLPPERRIKACGIDTGLLSFKGEPVRGYSGQLVGVPPGAPWEVRPHVRSRREQASNQEYAEIILAMFEVPGTSGLQPRAYVGFQGQVRECPHLQLEQLLAPELRTGKGFVAALELDESGAPPLSALKGRLGRIEIVADQQTLLANLGESDRPGYTFIGARVPGWDVGLRARMTPSDAQAARAAFLTYLSRRDADLRRDFDATCSAVADELRTYWQEVIPLPSPDEAAQELWTRPELRAAVCMRRLKEDLIEPYVQHPAQTRDVQANEVSA